MTNRLTGPNEILPVKWDTDLRYEEEYFECENLTWDRSHLCILTLTYILVLRKRLTVYIQSRTDLGRGRFRSVWKFIHLCTKMSLHKEDSGTGI